MANILESLPREQLVQVLEFLNIADQWQCRHVCQEFKNVVENIIWQGERHLQIDCCHYYIPTHNWESILSKMPNLRTFNMNTDLPGVFDEIVAEKLVNLLARYCHKVNDINCDMNGGLSLTYALQLVEQGVDIKTRKFIFIVGGREIELLDKLPVDGQFMLSILSDINDVPLKYRRKVLACGFGGPDMPYLPKLTEVFFANLNSSKFVQDYRSQITSMRHLNFRYADKLYHFKNLTNLEIQSPSAFLPAESTFVISLIEYLESNNSRHLHSLAIQFQDIANMKIFIPRFAILDRPSKWKKLSIKRDFYLGEELVLDDGKFSARLNFSPDLDYLFLNLFKNMKIFRSFKFEILENLRMCQLQFHALQSWLESYASKRRNMQISLELGSTIILFETSRKTIKRNNWALTYCPELIYDRSSKKLKLLFQEWAGNFSA